MLLRRIFARGNKYHNKDIDPEDIFIDSRNISKLDGDTFEGRFSKDINISQFLVMMFLVFSIFTVFLYKAYMLQVVNYTNWSDKGASNYLKKNIIFAYRGTILDRNNVPLAWNDSKDSILTSEIPSRHYIAEPGFGNLIGDVSYPKKDKSGIFWQDKYIGIEGIERHYNDILEGRSGEQILEVSAEGKILKNNTLTDTTDGRPVTLNIDSKLQSIFYKHLKKVVDEQDFDGGAGVMMDVNTGEVLALASYPDYDNNIYVNATTTEDKKIKKEYLESKRTPMLNRAVAGAYTPGSVVKPFMAYAALYEGVIDEFKNIYSSGQLVIKNKYDGPDTVFKDWKAHGYTDVRKAIAESSDEYFYQVGGGYQDQEGLGIKRIEKYMKFFGFASSTGIDFPKEATGIVPSPEWKKKNFEDGEWLLGNTYHTSIGQYGFKTTPIELARSIALIANGGKLITPRIASGTEPVENIDLNLDKKILDIVRSGMRGSASEGGTAHYFSDLPFKVAAKTGTAQLGFKNEYVNSWSSGYFPYENPKYVFVFMMEKGPHTNTVASSKVMREVFGDMIEETPEYTKF
jgi:penicillin-binding protein 2